MEQTDAWVKASKSKIRGKIVNERLVALRHGSGRDTRAVLARFKAGYAAIWARLRRS